MFDRSRKGENALIIQPFAPGAQDDDVLAEFTELARSAGASVVATVTARIERPHPAHYIGAGKLEEVRALCDASGADLVLVNVQLSPGQERNLEKLLARRVIDRTSLILDIFAQRAASHEGKLQVELAQLKHMATRLVRGWTHLERQRGGSIGLRGPGETQLETDRRLLQKRLEQLSKRLEKVEVQRTQMRRARLRNALPRLALVGYTNAGKSTLFNALTGSGVYAADKLFATLDPTVRRIDGLACGPLVISDTVGFVRDLPHELVAAFRSTLSEARDADLLLHVVDASDPLREQRIAQVDSVLEEIGAGDLPQILVFNKIDALQDFAARHDRVDGGRQRLWLSAKTGTGLDLLLQALTELYATEQIQGELTLDATQGRLRARLHAIDAVAAEQETDNGWQITVNLPRSAAQKLASEPGGHLLHALLLEHSHADSYN